jgi:hypothetical protein
VNSSFNPPLGVFERKLKIKCLWVYKYHANRR